MPIVWLGKRFRCILNETMDRRHQHCLSEEIDAIDANAKKVLEAKSMECIYRTIVEEQKQLVGLLEKLAATSKKIKIVLQFTTDLKGLNHL
jgi:hypothetical protein